MRLFAAVRPPPAALAHAAAAVEAVRAREPGPRWVPPQRWHLTLAFYGEVPEDRVGPLQARLDHALAGAAAPTLALRGAGAFRRQVLWLGVTGDVAALRGLAAGLDPDARPYRPHLTVARLRGDPDPTSALAALSAYAGPPWVAAQLHLVRSHLGPEPRYEDLASWPLR